MAAAAAKKKRQSSDSNTGMRRKGASVAPNPGGIAAMAAAAAKKRQAPEETPNPGGIAAMAAAAAKKRQVTKAHNASDVSTPGGVAAMAAAAAKKRQSRDEQSPKRRRHIIRNNANRQDVETMSEITKTQGAESPKSRTKKGKVDRRNTNKQKPEVLTDSKRRGFNSQSVSLRNVEEHTRGRNDVHRAKSVPFIETASSAHGKDFDDEREIGLKKFFRQFGQEQVPTEVKKGISDDLATESSHTSDPVGDEDKQSRVSRSPLSPNNMTGTSQEDHGFQKFFRRTSQEDRNEGKQLSPGVGHSPLEGLLKRMSLSPSNTKKIASPPFISEVPTAKGKSVGET